MATPKVLFGLTGHTTRINAVQWLTDSLIVSIGGDEKTIIVWQKKEDADGMDPKSWSVAWTNKDAHPSTINYLTTFVADDRELYFTTMCSEGVLKLWASVFDAEGIASF